AAGGNRWVNEGKIPAGQPQKSRGARGKGVPGVLFERVLNGGINDHVLIKQAGRIVHIFREVLSARLDDNVGCLTVPLTGHGQSYARTGCREGADGMAPPAIVGFAVVSVGSVKRQVILDEAF